MTEPTDTEPIDRAIRRLDVATATLSTDQEDRARASLERILAGGSPDAARRPARRVLLLAIAAVTTAVAALVVPGLGGGDAAYASWTATPAALGDDELAAATAACREGLRGYSLDVDRAEPVIAERRGDHVAMLFRTDVPDMSGACLARSPRGSGTVDGVDTAVGGSSGPALDAPASGFTQGTISEFGSAFAGDGASFTDGAAGADVVGVTIRAGTLVVQASVRDGRYAAWWPGSAFRDEPATPSGRGGPEPKLAYDLTLSDGTVVRDAQPTLPR